VFLGRDVRVDPGWALVLVAFPARRVTTSLG
jgi:hypothetical protein